MTRFVIKAIICEVVRGTVVCGCGIRGMVVRGTVVRGRGVRGLDPVSFFCSITHNAFAEFHADF